MAFDPKTLEGISEKLITSHWEHNYLSSVKSLNAVRIKLRVALEQKDLPPFVYAGLKREHLMRTGSVINHDLYFENLGGRGGAPEKIQQKIAKSFGSFELWEKEFRLIGNGLSGASGWVVLGLNKHLGLLENYWCFDHLHSIPALEPILVMDMYEHSYQMDYGAAADKYIDAFFQNINWEVVEGRVS